MGRNIGGYKRRDFLKAGAMSSGVLAGSSLAGSNTVIEGTDMDHAHMRKEFALDDSQHTILVNGYTELLRITEGLQFIKTPSDTYPFPLTCIAYDDLPEPESVRADVRSGMHSDPVGVMEKALALLELHETNQPGIERIIPDDMKFVGDCFNSKRLNGWIAFLGSSDREALETAINGRWKFRFFDEGSALTGVYTLLNMLVRYAHVYGRTLYNHDRHGDHFMDEQCTGSNLDTHDMTHFIDEQCPGLLVCQDMMTDLDLTVSLMAMKLGVPAVVPPTYPFPFGKTIRVERNDIISEAVVLFPNIRKLLDMPDIPPLPAYCNPENRKQSFKPCMVWGDTKESFYVVRKGTVEETGFTVKGKPEGPLGVVITIDAEPVDAFDREYIEGVVMRNLSMIRGVKADYHGDSIVISQSDDAGLEPQMVGEVLAASVQHEFPKLTKVHVDIILDRSSLSGIVGMVQKEKQEREMEIASTTEEEMDRFYSCTGCSPFAPNHMCVLTSERPPQCGRPFGMIKTGALYAYDDMTDIHHSIQQRTFNSFQTFDKGRCIDPVTGEWSGANEQIRRLTQARTRRVLLHSLKGNPHTGCGCFRLIMFETDKPRIGIGIMDRPFKGTCPDGRSWKDLHYALGGKQTPGVAGASTDYLTSMKFLQADGGWKNVVWVSPGIAKAMGDKLPSWVLVGDDSGKKS